MANSPFPDVPVTPTTPVVGAPQPAPQQPAVNPGQRQKGNPYKIDPRYRFRNNQAIFRRIFYNSIRPGALITFQYGYWKHDPYPLVLSTGRWISGKMAGVNLHYLTFGYIKNLITQFSGKNFTWRAANTPFTKKSFRCYHQHGMSNLRLLDAEFLIASLGQLRSFNPTEVAAMRQWVREQMARKLNQPTAEALLDQTTTGVHGELSDILNPNFQGNRYAPLGVQELPRTI